ncbi:YARHG domain-containing protein, partial [Parabacteroides distasonis]
VLSAQGAYIRAAAEMKTEASAEADYYLPESNSRCLEEQELEGWTRTQLEYGRYEIFARRGMLFETPEVAEYFSGKSWYFGFIKESDFPESMLNEYETANALLL